MSCSECLTAVSNGVFRPSSASVIFRRLCTLEAQQCTSQPGGSEENDNRVKNESLLKRGDCEHYYLHEASRLYSAKFEGFFADAFCAKLYGRVSSYSPVLWTEWHS